MAKVMLYGQEFVDQRAAMKHFAIETHGDFLWHVKRSNQGLHFVARHKVNANPQGEGTRRRYFTKVLKEHGFIR